MNSVSWFIYIAQVSNSLGIMFIVLGVIGLIFCGFYALISTVTLSIDADEIKVIAPPARYIAALVACLVIGNLMPEKNTMFAIAASQVGEKIANSEQVKGIADDATKALQQWIRKQIEPEKKDK